MSRIAYVNGRYVRHADAQVHVENRGMQFSDGVYEVIAVYGGRLVDLDWHHERLERSLGELDIPTPMGRGALNAILREMVTQNRIDEGIVYMQVDRGIAPRNHAFPTGAKPSLVVTARRGSPASAAVLRDGVKVITLPDQRWKRRDIKSVSLLPNVLAKQKAAESDAFEAWQIDDHGFVTEGCSSNAWLVETTAPLSRAPLNNDILSGITRRRILDIASDNGIVVRERKFTVEEAKSAREAF